MRRDASQIPVLKAIVEVRELQSTAARHKLARAGAALRERQVRQDEAAERLRDDQTAWVACMSAPLPSLAIAGAWAVQISHSESQLRQADAEVVAAEKEKTLRSDEWRLALTRADAVKELMKAATHDRKKRAAEAQLSALSDMVSRRMAGAR